MLKRKESAQQEIKKPQEMSVQPFKVGSPDGTDADYASTILQELRNKPLSSYSSMWPKQTVTPATDDNVPAPGPKA